MELHRIIKSDARRALRRYWAKSAVAVLVLFSAYIAVVLAESVLLFVFSGEESLKLDFLSLGNTSTETLVITGISAVLFCLLMPALIVGYKKLHLAFANGGEAAVAALFDSFSSPGAFFRAIVFALLLTVRRAVVFAAALLPGGALIYAAYRFIEPQTRTVYMLKLCAYCIGGILILLCLALALIFVQRWFAAPYYLAGGTGVHKAFALSVKATKGLCPAIIRFKISYFGWALLSVLVLPVLWSLPYYSTASAIYAKYLTERFEHGSANAADAANPLEHQQSSAFEHAVSTDEHASGESKAAAAPDDSFYVQNEHAVSTDEHEAGTDEHAVSTDARPPRENEHAPDDFGFAPLSPDQAEALSNHGAGKNPEEFIEKIKSLGEE